MNIVRLIAKLSLQRLSLLCFSGLALSLASCSSFLPNKGVIILDVQDKIQTNVTSQDLPKSYKIGNGEQELQRFEAFCKKEIRASQLDGSEEIVFENIKHGIHGQVEFKKCSDKITRIYRY
ncbi:hypothetical protein GQ597_06295 [Gilliamella sp. Pra-s65]|uniref:hypothetical protein n=1 Tax=unclassified Gilliamella TaxID=2685620 RepID=UPI001323084F|nr:MULTISPECIES: hypothetical protein [unclassified Gilliamella]MWN32801.1 hypothetical protein [Gilliamella sp. Pra-s60]MWN90309.1 hypothetical protein [Gilliamella sp. Pra-s65]MWP30270.1 hypothetical protein [Gilliamella sp. Pra-s54]MWP46422.1 hypothetical protein [Gilliamella sp. Pas-s27]MWP73234.1 hypothetical protein [Gilliamella sp. Pra-s52]